MMPAGGRVPLFGNSFNAAEARDALRNNAAGAGLAYSGVALRRPGGAFNPRVEVVFRGIDGWLHIGLRGTPGAHAVWLRWPTREEFRQDGHHTLRGVFQKAEAMLAEAEAAEDKSNADLVAYQKAVQHAALLGRLLEGKFDGASVVARRGPTRVTAKSRSSRTICFEVRVEIPERMADRLVAGLIANAEDTGRGA